MIHKMIFRLSYRMKRPRVLRYYDEFQKTQWLPFEELQERQTEQLRKLIAFAYKNVPYYTRVFNELGLKPSDIANIQDLEKLPILTKQIVKQNWQDFLPQTSKGLEYVNGSTGGSTGEPLKYRMSHEDHERGVALLYRCWAHAGYQLGDRLAVIAGSSLISTTSSAIHKRLQGFALNTQSYSSFGISEKTLFRYLRRMNRFKPKFIRGYASSVYLFANFIHSHKLAIKFHPQAVFTTAEKLFENQRETIEHVFGVKVFDNYGLNDGGVSACECEHHTGMHIDTERAILEVVGEDGKQVSGQMGHILATSLYNYSFPFVRYDTGDLGILSSLECPCGRGMPLLKAIVGRISDFIITPSGLRIHGEFFSHVFYEIKNVRQFQVIQDRKDRIRLRIVPDEYGNQQLIDVDKLKNTILLKDRRLKIDIEFVHEEDIEYTVAGKHKFIINTTGTDKA